MDDSSFDELTRSFAVPSRRAVLSALGAAIFPALFDRNGDENGLAKPKRGKARNRRPDAHAVQASAKGKGKGKKGKGKKKKKKGKPSPPPTNGGPLPGCAATCPGCCDGETCLAGTSVTACGGGGSPCRVCANPTPRCAGNTCAACTASSQCPSGTVCDGEQCQTCTVSCPGGECDGSDDLQPALNAGGTVYACPGRYTGSFSTPVSVTLIGAGDGTDPTQNTILDAAAALNQRNVLNTVPGLTVELRGLRLTGGSYFTSGGVDNWDTTLSMTNCTITGNTANNGGGGINNNGGSTLTMTDCTISDNNAGGDGAGIHNNGGSTVTLIGCAVTENIAGNHGGGIFNAASSTVTLNASSSSSSSVNTNTANGDEPAGGGIFNEGTVTIIDGTVSGNDPDECIDSGAGDGCP